MGGEEFLVVFPETELEEAQAVLKRLMSKLKEAQLPDPAERLTLTVSIGLVQFKPGESVGDILNRADDLLYAAKHAGRDQISHD
nr:GGDEF domain-containing protein [Vibrio mexicanus]